jgi:ABC-type nitrate/sulfonate/bicarbonate transport system, permease component
MIKKTISTGIIILIWWLAAIRINRSVILPLPIEVLYKMIELTTHISFYVSISATLLRVALSLILSMVIGITLGIFAGLYKTIQAYLSPIMITLQTIPQIAFILILLVWFDSFTALVMILFLLLFPIFYHNTVYGIQDIDCNLMDVIMLYHHPLRYNIFKVYLPLIKGYILSTIDVCFPLAFKAGVMAEIFVQTRDGIGSALYSARMQIDMVSIIAWTIWIIIIITIILQSFAYLRKRLNAF